MICGASEQAMTEVAPPRNGHHGAADVGNYDEEVQLTNG